MYPSTLRKDCRDAEREQRCKAEEDYKSFLRELMIRALKLAPKENNR